MVLNDVACEFCGGQWETMTDEGYTTESCPHCERAGIHGVVFPTKFHSPRRGIDLLNHLESNPEEMQKHISFDGVDTDDGFGNPCVGQDGNVIHEKFNNPDRLEEKRKERLFTAKKKRGSLPVRVGV